MLYVHILKLTLPSTVDAIKSFNDFVKSGLPVQTSIHETIATYLGTLSLFQPIKDRTTFNINDGLQRDRHDTAYLTNNMKQCNYLDVNGALDNMSQNSKKTLI